MIEYWHNPRCSKSRQGLALLQEHGASVTVRRYLEDAPSLTELFTARAALGNPPVIDMVRKGEATFKQLGLTKDSDDQTLLAAMAQYPILIERPLAILDHRAVIGHPPQALLTLV